VRILAIDSSTDWLSVAVGDGASWHAHAERASTSASERALPLVRQLLDEAAWPLHSLDGIAYGAGPGSFTGVRIACGIAQGLALGLDRPLAGVPTLLALAHGAWRARGVSAVFACLDARMREVYVAAYRRADAVWHEVLAPAVRKPDEVVAPPGTWHGSGDGFAVYPDLAQRLALADADAHATPSALAVAELALPRFASGDVVDAAHAEPLYVRHRIALTSAERDAGQRL
jgi:tRNA threonylcarbamoyladenosine biosynthesis protein TsaB